MKHLLIIVLVSLTSAISALGADSDSSHSKYGLYAGAGWNIHNASFRTLPGQPNCCDKFTNAHGLNFAIGGVFRSMVNDLLFLESRFGYDHLSGVFTRNESTKVIADNQFIDGLIEHYILANIGTIAFEQYVGTKFFDKFSFQIGASAGFLVLKSFHQKEEIIEPSDIGVFSDTKQRVRNDISGTIQETNMLQASAIAGLGYDFTFENKWFHGGRAELFGKYQFTNVLKDFKWNIFSLRAGVSLMFNKGQAQQIIPTDTIKRDSLIVDTLRLELAIGSPRRIITQGRPILAERILSLYKKDIVLTTVYRQTDTIYFSQNATCAIEIHDSKQKKNIRNISIHQQFTTQIFPILTKIFFDNNSSAIPARYDHSGDAATFSTSSVAPHPLVLNHQILNIIGYRMQEFTESNLTIKGYSDKSTEGGDCELARARAESAKAYIVKNWNIDPQRIICSVFGSNCSPKDATVSPIEEGYSENRRVEFESDDSRLLAEIVKSRYLESTFDPTGLKADITVSNPKDLSSWNLDILAGVSMQRIAQGFEYEDVVSFNSDEINYPLFSHSDTVAWRYSATMANGDSIQALEKVTVCRDTSSIEKQIISLTLFLVNNAEVSAQDKNTIREFARNLVDGDSVVIIGYTDKLGQFEDNLRLSVLRARNVADYLRSVISSNVTISSVDGAGSIKLPPQIKSYATPEERFLTRTVRIEVSRPLGAAGRIEIK